MTYPRMRHVLYLLGAASVLLFAACGGDSGSPPPTATSTATATKTAVATATATRTATSTAAPHPSPAGTSTPTIVPSATPTQSSAIVRGLVVVNHTVMSGPGDVLGAPPPDWGGTPDKAPFDRALANADWSVPQVDKQGVTGPDGRFVLSGLPPGHYNFQVTKTLDGNLATLNFPFSVGDDGTADVVAEVSWGLVRSTSTYTQAGAHVQDIRGPYGTWLITQDGRVREIGDPSRSFVDTDGDGQFETLPCVDHVWECSPEPGCGSGTVCSCTASCPACDDCGPGVCAPPASVPPYRCAADDTCSQAGDHCVCVSSCPDCKDCTRKVCVPNCAAVDITAIQITGGPSQLVVGQQSSVSAVAQLSDGSQIDVTQLATWHSSNDAVVTVDSWGQVTAHGVGSTALTATVGTLTSAPWSVEVVTRPTLQHIEVQNVSCYYPVGLPVDFGSQAPASAPPTSGILPPIPTCGQVVQIGRTIQFRAVGQFANGYYQDITDEVQWQVTPAAVGDVVGGVFTARQAGTTTLTASLEGVVSDGKDIRVVTEPTVTALSIYADSGIIAFVDGGPQRVDVALPCPIAAADGMCCCPGPLADASVSPCNCGYTITVLRGDQVKFRATAQYDTGEFRDVTDEVAWASSNSAAVTIDAHGVLTAVEAGDATIDAALGAVNSNTVGTHVVNEATLQSLYIYQDGTDRVVAKGDQRFFKATGNYDIGFGRDVTSLATWRSSDDTIGGFDQPGAFTGRAAGVVQVWVELDGIESERLSLEVYETGDITYCDPAHVNRSVWSDNFNLVTLESDCGEYRQPGVAALRYTVAELQPHGGVFDPCLDLYVYQGDRRVRTIREEGCGSPFLPANAPGYDQAAVKYQLRAFWDLKGDDGQPVAPGTYTIFGRFYLYYDPVVSLDVAVLSPDGSLPTPTPTAAGHAVCLYGPNVGGACKSDADCPQSRCVVANGRCSYGTHDADACFTNDDCPGGVCDPFPPTPTPTAAGGAVCLHGPNTGRACASDADCAQSRCAVATGQCTYGTYDQSPCVTDSDCPGGACVHLRVSPTPTRTATPRALCTAVVCLTGGVLLCPTNECAGGCGYVCVPNGQVVSLEVGSASGAHGDTVDLTVSLHTNGQLVAGVQNDLFFDPTVPIAARANGRPDCTTNPDIDKNATGFTFIPTGCHPGVDCNAIRALVIATDNTDPIPDAAVLYTCKVAIPLTAAAGDYPIFASSVVASDPTGARLFATSSSGTLTVQLRPGETPPTFTPTATPTATHVAPVCTPPPCAVTEVLSCASADECMDGCGFVCTTPTPTPAPYCTPPPPCGPDEMRVCPAPCVDGCGIICVPYTPGAPQPAIFIDPPTKSVSCDATFDLNIRSTGPPGTTLVITDLKLSNGYSQGEYGQGFTWDTSDVPALPIKLPSGASLRIPVAYHSGSGFPHSRLELVIDSNAANMPHVFDAYHGVDCGAGDTPTPTPAPYPVCTPPLCGAGQALICPGNCPGGCGVVCGMPSPTPTPQGFCFEGPHACTSVGSPTSHNACCMISRLSASPLAFSWCATSDFDPTTGMCNACAADPCGGEPPVPTP